MSLSELVLTIKNLLCIVWKLLNKYWKKMNIALFEIPVKLSRYYLVQIFVLKI